MRLFRFPRRALPVLLVACAGATACASGRRLLNQPSTGFTRATAAPEQHRAPTLVEVPKPLPLPGQLQVAPPFLREERGEAARLGKDARPEAVVQQANQRATQRPDSAGYFNAMMTYDFAPGALYQVYAAPLRLTDIALQPGERLLGKPVCGDTVRWVLAVTRSAEAGQDVQHVYVKPTRPGLHTTLALNTDRRTYLLELHSYKDTYMASVRWQYPQDEAAALEAQAQAADALERNTSSPAGGINLEAVNFDYRVEVVRGRPAWKPTQVFDDGKKTYIRFPAALASGEAPALFVLSRSRETHLVNYRVKNGTYVVDRLFEAAELRLGQEEQDVVRITRN